ncbi:MAG: polysaccharide lyase family protein, partial [Verrucomicrobiae bacterium]|nr:polysaccharide lyase family protein [Verrucomicrobiae bacterium]
MKRFLTHPAIRRGALPGAAGALLFFLLPNLRGEGAPLWALGTTDGVGAEFAAGARDQVRFVVGQSVVSRDFPAEHGGSVGWDGRAQEKPYTLVFELRQAPSGRYELVLDVIFQTGAPRELRVSVNGRIGIFPIRPVAMHPVWGEQGNEMLLARQRLVVPVDAAWLRVGTNEITLTPLGAGNMAYDALRFQRAGTPTPWIEFEPTIFFRKRAGRLVEVCEVRAPFERRFERGRATVRLGGRHFSATFTNGVYDFGMWVAALEIPADAVRGPAEIEVALDDAVHNARAEAHPAKQWKLFVCPKVHNDVGYTDLQPHVNELDTRNSDQVLFILRRFPFYRFNFETAWLVDNFLDCRTAPWRAEFLSQLRRGRLAVNALYLNLMTGLCSGEELYRAMYFTHALHRREGGNFDFACITDAPSHSWFVPTLLHDVGIRGFANGANQTRAPILHHSSLNEDSPFWWEGINGERVLMWYARSYVQLKRLVGPGWGGDISSVEYLRRSVPQFLARYQRADYVPDAVMIYGAYVDNAAIPETAEADTLAAWNREFEFPKLIVATDGDYYRYIESRFGARLPVYRGDCGAYWEDGAASTAQATALNRHTQRLLPAAETTAALASIFEPRQRYPAEEFWSAWRNVMFYNEHTWGAHNSIAQPGREFVERQWEIKESYAARANLDARNLLARAHNRLAQVIAVDGSSVIAFNWQNRPRTAPLEIELGSSEQLVDLSNERVVALDVYAEQDGWRKVRFLATDVPALGYKVFAKSVSPTRAFFPAPHEKSKAEERGRVIAQARAFAQQY